jgi:conflict system pore-forming effector with SLATT domain
MFRLNVIDHVRLNLACAVRNYTVHAEAAERLAGLTSRTRLTVLVLSGAATAAAVTNLIVPGRPAQMAAAVSAALAFGGYASYLAVGLEGRVHAHRECAHRLWLACDRHRALLAEIEDGLLDRPSILQRRDELGAQMHAVYDQAFPPDQRAFETVRQPLVGSADAGDGDGDREREEILAAPAHSDTQRR